MEQRQAAVHRTIIVVDVEGFGDRRRILPHQLAVRQGLYGAVREAFEGAGVPGSEVRYEDRGDAVFVLVAPEVPKERLVVSLPGALVSAVRAHNATHRVEQEIRLRMALHAGEVAYDEHGVTATAVTLTFRLADASPVKAALAESPGVLALITSAWFFDEVVRHCPGAEPARYRPVRVAVKETVATGWICLPDHPYPANPTVLASPPPAADPDQDAGLEPASTTARISMNASASDSGRVYQAARDQHITEA